MKKNKSIVDELMYEIDDFHQKTIPKIEGSISPREYFEICINNILLFGASCCSDRESFKKHINFILEKIFDYEEKNPGSINEKWVQKD